MNIRYTKAAVKAISAMDSQTKQRIRRGVEGIPAGNIKPLRGCNGLYRLRIGGWRVIFSYPDEATVLVEKVAPRGGAYKGGL